jgi:6-phosphogluconolactonase
MPELSKRFVAAFIFLALLSVALTPVSRASERSGQTKPVGAVYALTNATSGNGVAVFDRARDGTLTFSTIVSTGGLGIGDGPDTEGLQSQGALVLGTKEKYLYCVNAGNDTLTVFAVDHSKLNVVQIISSGGHRPISIAIRNQLLYVLNYDRLTAIPDIGNVTAFKIGLGGILKPLDNSTRALVAAGLNPGQIAFSPDGQILAMTAKNTDQIITYHVALNGTLDAPVVHPSAGVFPFSLAFAGKSFLLTADDFNDVAGAGAASSYRFGSSNDFKVVSSAVPNHQDGSCWIVVTPNSRYAFVDNTNNSVIAGYKINSHGFLTLVNADGKTGMTHGVKPRDLAFASKGKFLYAMNSASGTVDAFKVAENGSLTNIGAGAVGTFPAPGANGLAAR